MLLYVSIHYSETDEGPSMWPKKRTVLLLSSGIFRYLGQLVGKYIYIYINYWGGGQSTQFLSDWVFFEGNGWKMHQNFVLLGA